MSLAVTPRSPQKHWPLGDGWSSSSSLIPHKGCTCKQDWTWSLGHSFGTGSAEISSQGRTIIPLVDTGQPTQARSEASSLGSTEERPEALVGQRPVLITSSGAAGVFPKASRWPFKAFFSRSQDRLAGRKVVFLFSFFSSLLFCSSL